MPAAGADTSGSAGSFRSREARHHVCSGGRAPVRSSVRAVGILKYAEPTRVRQARVGGWVEQLYADYVGKRVEQGDPLLALYSPDLVSAQEEYLLARRLKTHARVERPAPSRPVEHPARSSRQPETRGSVTRTLLLRAPRAAQ